MAEHKGKSTNERLLFIEESAASEVQEMIGLEGQSLKDYLNDMDLARKFTHHPQKEMTDLIVKGMGLTVAEE